MNVEKAIKILQERVEQGIIVRGESLLDACKLGTEALKGLSFLRTNCSVFPEIRLPGETED